MTQRDLDVLEQGLKQYAPEVLEPESSLIGRSAQQVADLPSNILQSFVRTGEAIGNLGLPESEQSAPIEVPKPYDIPQPTGLGETSIDVLLGQLAPELAAALVPYAGVSKLGRAAGLGRFVSEAAGQAAAGAFTGIKSGPEEALKQAGIGGVLGGVSLLPHAQRLLPLAGLAGAEFLTQPTPEAGATAAGLDVAFGMLPGSLEALRGLNKIKPEVPTIPTRELPFTVEGPQGPARLTDPEWELNRRMAARGIGNYPEVVGDIGAPESILEARQTGTEFQSGRELTYPKELTQLSQLQNQFREGEKLISGRIVTPGAPTQTLSLSDIFIGPRALRPSETFGRDLIEPIPQIGEARPQNLQTAMELAQLPIPKYPETGMHQEIPDMPKIPYPNPEPARSRISELPEYRRTEGGQIGFPLLGGLGGATIGGTLPAEDEQQRWTHILEGGLIGLTGGHALASRTNRIGAINLGQPFRTSFEREAVEATGPERRIIRLGTRDIGKSGLLDLKSFQKSANISNAELESYRLKYPEAFSGQVVDVQKLRNKMAESPLLKITDLPHSMDSNASAYDKAIADLQHTVDNIPNIKLVGEPGNHGLEIKDNNGDIHFRDFEIQPVDPLYTQGLISEDLMYKWNSFVNADWLPDEDSARSASVRYDSYGLNPRPLAELQKKEGFDQIIQIPHDAAPNQITYYQEPHFNSPDDINTLSHTRNYIDDVPGKGRTLISYENQQQWQQSLRDYYQDHPLIELDKLPKGWKLFQEGGDKFTGKGYWTLDNEQGLQMSYGDTKEEVIQKFNNEIKDRSPAKEHPMVEDSARLSAKGLIDRALKDSSIKGILSTDAETVVLTEKHDEVSTQVHKLELKPDEYVVRGHDQHVQGDRFNVTKYGQSIFPLESPRVQPTTYGEKINGIFARVKIPGSDLIVRIDKPEDNTNSKFREIAKEISKTYEGGKTLPEKGTYYIPQMEGMKEHYDRRLKNIYQELTGSTPEHISLGENSHITYGKKWEVTNANGSVVYKTDSGEDVRNFYEKNKQQGWNFFLRTDKGSEALNNKSDISGWWFSLSKLRALKERERGELFGATKFPEHPIRSQVGTDIAENLKEIKSGLSSVQPDVTETSVIDVPRIISTAVMHEGKPLTGPTPQSSHQQVMAHNPEMLLADVPPDLNKQGGFMIREPSGQERFATREETTKIGHASGQIPLSETGPAHSQIVDWKSGGMKLGGSSTGGFISAHAATTVAGAAIGGEEGYRQSGGDPQAALAGAIIGGAGGYLGYKMIEAITRSSPELRKAPVKESIQSAKDLMNKPIRDISGEEVRGRGGVMSKFIRGLEHWTRLNLPETVKTAWTQARGKGVLAVSAVQQAFKALKQFDPTPEIREAASRFIDGQLLEPEDALRIIRRDGGIAPAEWEALAADSRPEGFGTWKVKVGPNEESLFHISPDTKARLIAAEEDLFTSKLGPDNEIYRRFVTTARRAVDELQSIFASGMPDGRLKSIIQNSTGQYLTRTYKIFTDPHYRPTDEQIEKSMRELAEYKDLNKIKYTDDSLRIEIEQYLHDVKTNKELFGSGLGLSGKTRLDTTLFKEREDLTPTFRELLGEYRDPKERLIQAISRLFPSAQASHFINLAKGIELDGLPAAMTEESWVKMLAEEKDPQKLARLKELIEVPKSLKYGALKGLKVNRFIADQLMEIDGPLGMAAHPIMRGLNNWSKIIHTAYDPLRHVRNLITTPMFLWFGKASMESVDQAVKVLTKKDGQLYREMIENGVLTADQVASEFRGTAQQLFNGHYDSSLTRKAKAFHNSILELYRLPDLAVRAATYIEAKSRFSAKLRKPIDDLDVIKAAVQWTDERTMNYDNIAPAVRLARQVPFFNLYISYTAEMARIMKNITKDAFKGDIQSMLQLGTIAGVFEGAQAISEANLSEKDRKDWKLANAQGPAYSRSRYKYVTSRDAKGNFHYTDFTPLIPTDNFNQMFRAIAKGDTEGFAAVNPIVGFQQTPVFKIIAEQVTGKDIFTDREFRGTGDRLTSIVQELSPTLTPGVGYEWKKFATIGQENTRTGRQETWPGMVQKYLTGLAPTTVNPTVTQRSALSEAKRHIANERAYLTDVLKMKGISPEQQQRAIKKYQDAIATVLETYRAKSNL